MSGKDPIVVLKDYLRHQNRPYSVNDLVLNLHKEFGKTAAQKALDSLVADGDVIEKVNGKQKAYVINQANMPTASEAELSKLDSDALKNMESSLTTEEALRRVKELEGTVSEMEERLEKLSSNCVLVSKADKENVMRGHENAVKEWRKRKRIVLNITEAILESYPKSKKTLYQEIEIETDEDAGVQIPDI
ncbi:Diacylglycerol kinase [Caligus rogercresseyi]|uniref:Homologous-pairing protein 2 homolog n=1 Tax=Caligus rogercresseyi TaxID=217165 RepID=A0A7T8HGQ8_CALRO|nr:Diacylglycerol kinase [Caligus rogercresseyi]